MKINKLLKSVAVVAIATTSLLSTTVSAKQFWSDYSITALTGSDYLNPFTGNTDDRNVVTIEHASGHSWGRKNDLSHLARKLPRSFLHAVLRCFHARGFRG